ncbi:MAG: hypothetical protein IT178_01195 [Acidobacteria bacterium]|nr:hypothetical protein [Acidobacteriota bacterium]
MRARLCLALAVLLGPAVAVAEQLPRRAIQHLDAFEASQDHDELLNVVGTDIFADYLIDRALLENPDRVELGQLRSDLQLGALTGRTGSTSVVARPGISEFLSAAIESGAVARKTDDTSLTLNVNALLLGQILRGQMPRGCGSLDDACRQGPGRWFRGLSGSASFATGGSGGIEAGTNAGEVAAIVDGRQVTALSVRYELMVRERNVASMQATLEKAREALQKVATAFLSKQATLETSIRDADPGWREETLRLLEAETSAGGRRRVLLRRFEALLARVESSTEIARVRAAAFNEYRAYVEAQNKLLSEKLYRKALTVDYLHERPTAQPSLEQVRLVFSTPLGRKGAETFEVRAPKAALTMNAGVSFFNPRANPGDRWQVRDTQFSAALDWTPNQTGTLRATFTAAYYFQYMVANGVLKFDKVAITPGGAAIPLPKAAVELLNTKGDIHVGQLRLSIPAGQGVSIPLAVTYSNRTELIKADRGFWQGHAGVSYDLGALKQLFARR